ncbi:hypothetical protein R6242_10385 [Iodobacter sp. CM08]|uniref:hypothetical protein n=1 Tax=Iodobacter sp. CM08 TaxID=3085902 RepID=UPI002981B219|nr:hypothetical protein [Iodobacter sp. CM08]MDW5416973.1 hypothetical protein [Iodobacter sp. CM08]
MIKKNVVLIPLMKIMGLIMPLAFYAVLHRHVSINEFGIFQTLIGLLSFISLLESGVTPSFRNGVLLDGLKSNDVLSSALITSFFFSAIAVATICIVWLFFGKVLYPSILVPISFSIVSISLVGSCFQVYDDLNDNYLFGRFFDFISNIAGLLFACFLLYFSYGIYVVFFCVCLFKISWTIFSIFKYKNIVDVKLTRKNLMHAVFQGLGENSKFVSIQLLNTVVSFGIIYILCKYNTIAVYGVFAVFFRFLMVPVALYGSIAPILWGYFSRYKGKVKNNMMFFIFSSSIVFLLAYCILPYFVKFYLGADVQYPGDLFFLTAFCFTGLLKDVISTYFNAFRSYLFQIILLIANVFVLYYSDAMRYQIDELFLALIFYNIFAVLTMYVFMKNTNKVPLN